VSYSLALNHTKK